MARQVMSLSLALGLASAATAVVGAVLLSAGIHPVVPALLGVDALVTGLWARRLAGRGPGFGASPPALLATAGALGGAAVAAATVLTAI